MERESVMLVTAGPYQPWTSKEQIVKNENQTAVTVYSSYNEATVPPSSTQPFDKETKRKLYPMEEIQRNPEIVPAKGQHKIFTEMTFKKSCHDRI